ncbi:MFS transporter xanthine/uracil permease [Isosphaera pallida ATCC 43644]|jgi:AGZA family xanthine/uracil permease-like MFS transporter|uniref:MFS transporter xanthine/uracil permease n=1 Tax=Isosphaera pallida (strain ATCC 43644 / DSM 9630 / IS1B) TaxID=575540 RepID=E8R593_ISOPI|nr:hypothetical protein [Isosphaera pallida]ADV63846.1 MFS transporter xanthine/uracil permease [Isosphaera pallida ATCC 43644]
MTADPSTSASFRYSWAARGDFNAFFGLMLDNIGVMILLATLLSSVFGVPVEFILTRMIPGTALGVLFGDLIYTFMAFQLAKRKGRGDVTAMPLGLDTPSTFGMVFLVLGPAFLNARQRGLEEWAAAEHIWHLGIALMLLSGVFKLACATLSGWIRRVVPRAGLLGSLAAIALVLISFLPLLEIMEHPVAGLAATFLILTALTARWILPRGLPGALGSLVVGCAAYYAVILGAGALGYAAPGSTESALTTQLAFRLPWPMPGFFDWIAQAANLNEVLLYLPIALPLALATVVGGIDCAESAATVGDDYPTGTIIGVEGAATLIAGLFGGVIQSTPYIGHPAYKAMGGRAAYTLATALFVGGAGLLGYFAFIFQIIPKPAIFPILIFVGVEITASSYQHIPRRHFPALALACLPALAYLALIPANDVLAASGKSFAELPPNVQHTLQTLTVLSGGFIVTGLVWATALVHLIDGRARSAAFTFLLAALLALFGVIHSPLPSGAIGTPWSIVAQLAQQGRLETAWYQTPWHWAAGYALVAVMVLVLQRFGHAPGPDTPDEPKAI